MDEPDYTDPDGVAAKVLADQEMQQREATKRMWLTVRDAPNLVARREQEREDLRRELKRRDDYKMAQLWRTCETCGPPPEDLVDLIDEMNERDRIYYGRDRDTSADKPGDPADALDDKFKKVLP